MHVEFTASLSVCHRGYHWHDRGTKLFADLTDENKELSRWVLRDGVLGESDFAEGVENEDIAYDPFQNTPSLFYDFSLLNTDRDSVLRFANKYGPLQGNWQDCTWYEWVMEIELMRNAIDLWEAVKSRKQSELARHVTWEKSGRLIICSPVYAEYEPGCIDYGNLPPFERTEEDYKFRDYFLPARDLLDWKLSTSPIFTDTLTQHRHHSGHLIFSLNFATLQESVWAQFSVAVAESKQFRKCEACDKRFELSPDKNRADRLFCSDACRVRAYRQRRAKAEEMRNAGMSLREIAKTVGTDMATAKQWLKDIPKGGK